MKHIKNVPYDKRFPFAIVDAWGGEVSMTEEGLKELKKEIEEVLDKLNKK